MRCPNRLPEVVVVGTDDKIARILPAGFPDARCGGFDFSNLVVLAFK
jgi:hypothetical protein